MCFDKTGTLTEDGLDMLGIRILSKYERIHCGKNLLSNKFKKKSQIKSD